MAAENVALRRRERPGRLAPQPEPTQGAIIGAHDSKQKIEMDGEVVEALRGRMFRVQLDNGHVTLGYLGGKMKQYRIKVLLGDRVRVELSPYDLMRGRIVYRYR